MDHLPHRATPQTLQLTSPADAFLFPTSRSSIPFTRPSTNPTITSTSSSSIFYLHHSYSFLGSSSKRSNSCGLCFAKKGGSPLPESDPPPGKHLITTSDLEARFSKVQDSMQIFLAVLFWMSLFFWSCIWDGKNSDGPSNKSRFKR